MHLELLLTSKQPSADLVEAVGDRYLLTTGRMTGNHTVAHLGSPAMAAEETHKRHSGKRKSKHRTWSKQL